MFKAGKSSPGLQLVIICSQISTTNTLYLLLQWVPRESDAPISHATYSCDSQLIYASFLDATVCIFTAGNLHMQCCIYPSAYLSPGIRYLLQPVNLFRGRLVGCVRIMLSLVMLRSFNMQCLVWFFKNNTYCNTYCIIFF